MGNGNFIICGFPGVGKTTAAKSRNILDMESTGFHYKLDPSECEFTPNPDWPTNYLDAIEQAYLNDYNEVILTSTHEEVVLSLLNNRELPVIVVVPEATLRNEYMIRYLKRGSDPEFIYKMYNNWLNYINAINRLGTNEKKVPIISLKSGQYLSDVLPML
jgi:hypothetical protein